MAGGDEFGVRNALRLLWHFLWHPSHTSMLWYDVRNDVVRCKCGVVFDSNP